MANLPSLGNIDHLDLDPELKQFLRTVKDLMEIMLTPKGGSNRVVTREMLTNLGLDVQVADTVEPQYDFSGLL
jgi:hypothetical protein